MRATTHNGRTGKNGAYSPKHNDRNFDLSSAEHINQDKTNDNWYWHRYQKGSPELTFEEVEKAYYEKHLRKSLEAKNERYRKSGHKKDIKTIDEYRQSRLSCPEETILQIGKAGDTIDPDLLKKICIEYINWEIKMFPNVKLMNLALHVDEEGAPHIHERKVWVVDTPEGEIVGQAKALKEMGIERPDTNKKEDRYNNPKTAYTGMCRNKFLSICRSYGLDIETEPEKTSKRGLDLLDYKRRQEQEKLEQLTLQMTKKEQELQETELKIKKMQEIAIKKAVDMIRKEEKAELYDKARNFMTNYNVNGKTLDKIFDEQVEIEKQNKNESIVDKARKFVKEYDEYDDDYDLDL